MISVNAVREALREAQKFRKDWERTVGRREHELLSGAVWKSNVRTPHRNWSTRWRGGSSKVSAASGLTHWLISTQVGRRGRLRRGALAGAALPGGLLSRPDGARAPARSDVLEAGVGVHERRRTATSDTRIVGSMYGSASRTWTSSSAS